MNKKLLRKKKKKLLQKLERKIIGYHVYRSENEKLPFAFWARMTDEPIPEGSFNDPAAELGKRYFYKLTQVYEDGKESQPITPKSSFTDHAGNSYEQNPLADFVGYNMYRSADESVPLDQWERRNEEPIPTTEYKDEGVKSGEVYFYYVRAVDSKGTESTPGEIVRVIRK
jgi:fibronectin type 3 domain-containing protein